MALHDKILDLLNANNITVSEWLVTADGRNLIKPPYVCVQDVSGHGIYADGTAVIEIETVNIHVVYRPDDETILEQVKKLLKPYGSEWKKEKFSAERVMICTMTLEG